MIERALAAWHTLAALLAGATLAAGCSGDRAEAKPAAGSSRAAPAVEPPSIASPVSLTAPGPASSPAPAPAADTGDYPLKQWMSANLARPVKTEDFAALEHSLATAAGFAPPEFPGWRAIAEGGARAARARDIAVVRASCTDCHNEYRHEYRETMRTRSLSRKEASR